MDLISRHLMIMIMFVLDVLVGNLTENQYQILVRHVVNEFVYIFFTSKFSYLFFFCY